MNRRNARFDERMPENGDHDWPVARQSVIKYPAEWYHEFPTKEQDSRARVGDLTGLTTQHWQQ
ncbi:hypothetical protein [Bradyrhizobium sp. BR 1432]|uniref:hypothetical protein n=1 Tax=Bradyrhizobium sp. BR 1432 TaxID=3447966 RepID=UPI003EE7802E